ncbi:unnamed protein product [Linum trigynum]|uniref:Uncharacterized protein n=1 Tax=Linum trigynum TaxID=586398 RepID=A0AAV2DWK4_9ROSI
MERMDIDQVVHFEAAHVELDPGQAKFYFVGRLFSPCSMARSMMERVVNAMWGSPAHPIVAHEVHRG